MSANGLQPEARLQIGGVFTVTSSWVQPGKEKDSGAQIDLVIDRADRCINICEIKFSTGPFAIDKKYADTLQNKLSVFGRRHSLATALVA